MSRLATLFSLALLFLNSGCAKGSNGAQTTTHESAESARVEGPMATTATEWKELSSGLWRKENGDVGFREFVARGPEGAGGVADHYITQLDDGAPLKDVVDADSFRQLSKSSFYKDEKRVYQHYSMAYGGKLSIVKGADVSTFALVGNCYAKDNAHVYYERSFDALESVDRESFQSCDTCGCVARDKNGFYSRGEKIDVNAVEDPEVRKAIEELMKP